MRAEPKPMEVYRHFKGNLYQINCLAVHSETGERLVIYQALYGDYQMYARPLSMFMEEVDREKYPEVTQKYRFESVTAGMIIAPSAVKTETEAGGVIETVGGTKMQDAPTSEQKSAEDVPQEEGQIDPLVLEFFDAQTYEERLQILSRLHERITDDMIDMMGSVLDLEIKKGDIEQRYEELKRCLLTFDHFECSRLR